MRRGIPNLFKDGTKHRSGVQDAVLRNIDACHQLSDLTRTSLGPNGMNKMVTHILTTTLTSQAHTRQPAHSPHHPPLSPSLCCR